MCSVVSSRSQWIHEVFCNIPLFWRLSRVGRALCIDFQRKNCSLGRVEMVQTDLYQLKKLGGEELFGAVS
ncbi:hypothetical protein YC2023_096325 [Brassica napus]